ncbi:MAG: bestrophin family ion channel [Pseudomonadota bacterium]
MYIVKGMNKWAALQDARYALSLSFLWSVMIFFAHVILEWKAIALPQLPVTTIGIVVSLYLGFKSTSAYSRWWEARKVWGSIVNASRIWANQALAMPDQHDNKDALTKELVTRHMAWVQALAYQLRAKSRLPETTAPFIFGSRVSGIEKIVHSGDAAYYQGLLSESDRNAVAGATNPAVQILRLQGDHLRRVHEAGLLDSFRFVAMMQTINDCYDYQGMCERIKNTPFPRQFTVLGRYFAWIFIFLLPLAFVQLFEQEVQVLALNGLARSEYMFALVPFTMLVSLIFYLLEKVSESCEDPFEWSPTDVPVAALSRAIEIDLRQMLGETDTPEPLQPIRGAIY